MDMTYFVIIGVLLIIAIVVFLSRRKGAGPKTKVDTTIGEVDRYALVDRETGLYNKNFFLKKIDEEIQKSSSFQSSFTIALLNFPPQFEQVGDKEALLRKIGTILTRDVRFSDVVSRYGPTNIGILYPMTNRKGAEIPTARLKDKVDSLLNTSEIEGEAFFSLVSYPENSKKIEEFITETTD